MRSIFLLAFLFYALAARADVSGCRADALDKTARKLQPCAVGAVCTCEKSKTEITPFMTPPLETAQSVYACEDSASPAVTNSVLQACAVHDSTKHTSCSLLNQRAGRTGVPIGEWLVGYVGGYPAKCGYKYPPSRGELQKALQSTVVDAQRAACVPSMCTSATFLAFLGAMKRLHEDGKLPGGAAKLAEYSTYKSLAWSYINILARPDRMMTDLGLGDGRVIGVGQIEECSTKGWPKAGDILQIWRDDGSGHSVITDGYLYDSSGRATGICYWSSNKQTDGYARRCETLRGISKMIVGRIKI